MRLKKSILATSLLLVMTAVPAKAIEIGVPFFLSDGLNVGARLHFGDFYALQPSVGVMWESNFSSVGFDIRNLFYLSRQEPLSQYLGANVYYVIESDIDNTLGIGAFYGLQHQLTEVLDIYGELGGVFNLEPSTFFTTLRTAAGLIFYFR